MTGFVVGVALGVLLGIVCAAAVVLLVFWVDAHLDRQGRADGSLWR